MICYAIHLELTTDKHLWILPGFYDDGWWLLADKMSWQGYQYSCTSDQIVKALDNAILLHFNFYLLNEKEVSFTGYVSIL